MLTWFRAVVPWRSKGRVGTECGVVQGKFASRCLILLRGEFWPTRTKGFDTGNASRQGLAVSTLKKD